MRGMAGVDYRSNTRLSGSAMGKETESRPLSQEWESQEKEARHVAATGNLVDGVCMEEGLVGSGAGASGGHHGPGNADRGRNRG